MGNSQILLLILLLLLVVVVLNECLADTCLHCYSWLIQRFVLNLVLKCRHPQTSSN